MRNKIIAALILFICFGFNASPTINIQGKWIAECVWSSTSLLEESTISRLFPLVYLTPNNTMDIGTLELFFDSNNLYIGDSAKSEKVNYRYKRNKLSFVSDDIPYTFYVQERPLNEHTPRRLTLISTDDNLIILTQIKG
jgi:hypothetical protein